MKAEDYFKSVYESSAYGQKISLNNIKAVCDDLESRNLKIRIMLVGRECKRIFGMTTSNTIKGNDILKNYIKIRSTTQKIESIKETNFDDIMEQHNYVKLENKKLRELLSSSVILTLK